jgi:dihydroorotate dehydrogenase electron transfer subunit
MDDFQGRVEANTSVGPGYYFMKIGLARPLGAVEPGQFVMVRLPSADYFLRRPFSIYGYGQKWLSILYRVSGGGTEYLSSLKKGQQLAVLGPLGKGFEVTKGRTPVIISGGIGIAGIHLLWQGLKRKAVCFFGCSTEKELCLIEDPAQDGVVCSTLDGSFGFNGNVVQLLESRLPQIPPPLQIFACGPEAMYKALRSLLDSQRIPCQVLLEERMACGLGLCFGCVRKTSDESEPYKRVCLEGPVFDLWQISL